MSIGKEIAKEFLLFLLGESVASEEAKKKGLRYGGFGRWIDGNGVVVAKTEDDKLVSIDTTDKKLSSQSKQHYVKTEMPDATVRFSSKFDEIDDNEKLKVSIVLDRLKKIADAAIARGESAPTYNLCQIHIPGTNLFCGGNMGVSRLEMPQFKGVPQEGAPANNLPKNEKGEVNADDLFHEYLNNSGIKVLPAKVPVDRLKSTQNQLVGAKVARMVSKLKADPNHHILTEPIFISRDGYVLDGHHRWAAAIGLGLGTEKPPRMNVKVVDMDIRDLLPMARKFADQVGIKQKSNESLLKEESEASKEAKKRKLTYGGFGRWLGANGGVVAKTVDDKLVDVEKERDNKTQPTSSAQSTHGASKKEKSKSKDNKMVLVGIYSGRFQPFGPHHHAAFKQLQAITGNNTYIATSNVTDDAKSPFNFMEKKTIIMKYGIPSNRIVRTKSPYNPEEILSKYNSKSTALVVIFGEKDSDRLHSGGYYEPLRSTKNLNGYKDTGYYIIAKHESVVVDGQELSGTQIRKFLGSHKIGAEKKKKLFRDIFGWYDSRLFDRITKKIGRITPKNESLILEGGAYGLDYTICEECKSKIKQINLPHVLLKHNMTLDEYKIKHPNSILVPEGIKLFGNKNPMKIFGVAERHKHIMSNVAKTKEFRDAVSLGKTGKPRVDMIGEGNVAKRNDVREKISIGVKSSYNSPELVKLRREQFTTIRRSDEYKNRMYQLGLWRRPELKKEWERYYNNVKLITEQNFSKYFYFIPLAANRSREYHLDHLVSVDYGFCHNVRPEIIGHKNNLRIVHHSINEAKGRNNGLTLEQLLHSIGEINNPLDTRILLLQGGAYGHMSHPFDDNELTFGDLKEIIILSLQGQLNKETKPMEKLDGQALSISWVNGKLVAARNKGHLKNSGAAAPDVGGIKTMFAGRGALEKSFGGAMDSLQNAISGLTEKQREKIFQNGQNFMALEVIYPKTENVIPYGQNLLVFHGVISYDNNGNPVGENKEYARVLAGMIKQVNADVQGEFKISAPTIVEIPKVQDFSKRQTHFISKVDTLKNKLNLKDSDTVALYHQRWWEEFINARAKTMKYNMPNVVLVPLVKRWAFDDKSNKLIDIIRDIHSEPFAEWVKSFESENHQLQVKENMKPFEKIFLELGVEVLSNARGFIAANPSDAVQKIREKLRTTIDQLKKSKDLSQLDKLKTELQRIQTLGGFDKIVPTEGIVFMYKGKTFKLTGSFPPVNKILGILKYGN